MSLFSNKKTFFSKKGNIAFSLLALMGFAAFVLIGFNQPTQDIFLGAQVGKGGETEPSAPVLSRPVEGDGQVELSWTADSDGGSPITGHVITVSQASKSLETITTRGEDTTYTVTDLENDSEYDFTVVAVNAVGSSEPSNTITATPSASKGGVTEPDSPTNLQATSGDGQIQISWTAPGNDGGRSITEYLVSLVSNRGQSVVETKSTNTQYVLSGLSNGTQYTIKVAAVNAVGTGTYSSSVLATPNQEVQATIPDIPTGITLTPGDATISVSWIAPNNGGSAITGYTVLYIDGNSVERTVNLDASKVNHTLTGLVNGTSYTIKVKAKNSVGDGSYSVESKSSPDKNIAPTILGLPTVTVSDTSAVIVWSTNKNTSTKVDFGLLPTKTSTPEYNRNTRVTDHTVTIVDLLPCTTYSFVAKSYDSLSQVANGSEQKFTTTGCTTTAEIQEVKEDIVDTTEGGVVDFTNTDIKTKLTIPQNLKVGESDVLFQVRLLEKLATKEEIGLPTKDVLWLGGHVYDFSAYSGTSEEKVNDFDNPVLMTIEYSREDVQGVDLNTLVIHHYEEGIGWRALSECINTYDPKLGVGEISCNTDSFSIFGLFGESATGISTSVYIPNSSSSGGTNTVVSKSSQNVSKTQTATTTESMVVLSEEIKADMSQEDETGESEDTKEKVSKDFNKDLWLGVAHTDVIDLQKFLNQQGFTVAESGPGSPGKETGYFGYRTFRALGEFQTFYRESITSPSSFQKATGYLDYFTRQFIQTNF